MLMGDHGMMLEHEAVELLQEFDVPYPDRALARDAEEAARIADLLGYPVVLKIVSPQVIHKSDVGGVRVGLTDAEGVRQAFQDILDRVRRQVPDCQVKGVLVCRLAPPGVEMIVGALQDPTFGPVLMCGLGGLFTEVLRDVAFRVVPLQRRDAADMLRQLRGWPLLNGIRAGLAPT